MVSVSKSEYLDMKIYNNTVEIEKIGKKIEALKARKAEAEEEIKQFREEKRILSEKKQ